jgi:hypothetical protein
MLAILAIIFLATTSLGAYGQTPPDAYIWIPEDIITGESYEAVIVTDKTSWAGKTAVISTDDPTVIQVPHSVTIMPHSNHGIFPLKPLRDGTAQVFALIDGNIISTKTTVHSSSRQPEKLSIILAANSTKADDIIGYVLSVDGRGTPAPVPADTLVQLFSSSLIDIDAAKIKILKDHYQTRFHAKIRGSGNIYASAENYSIAERHIEKIADGVTVKVAVAPNIMMENSKAFLFVWLEKDGKPFKLPHMTYAFVSSSNLKSVRLNDTPTIKQYGDSILKIPIVNGVGKGQVISDMPGTSTITASVNGFGASQASVVVGPVLVDQNFEQAISEQSKMDKIESKKPNVAMAWIYPTVTDSVAYGVVALYNMNFTHNTHTTITENNTKIATSSSINRIVPVPIDGRTITLSSTAGLQHPGAVVLSKTSQNTGSTHAVQFEVVGVGQGNHTVFVSGPGLEQYRAFLKVTAPFSETYKIKPVRIPTLPETLADQMIISITDDDGALVDPRLVFLEQPMFSIVADNVQTQAAISSNSAVHSGTINGTSKIVISWKNLAPTEMHLVPSGIAASITLDVPPKVHITESFPYSVHEKDSFGIPIRKLNSAGISFADGVKAEMTRMRVDSVGVKMVGAVASAGAESKHIESFANTFNIDAIPSGITNRIDRPFQIEIVSDVGEFDLTVNSPFPYQKTEENLFTVTPNKAGSHDIVFVASKDGYAPAVVTFPVFAEKFVNLSIRALASDGSELNIQQSIQIGNTTKLITTPHYEEVKPQFLQSAFAHNYVGGNNGYRLNTVTFGIQNAPDGTISNLFLGNDTEIIAKYDRTIKVDVENADGSGFYSYGHKVVITANPRDKAWFFVRDVFDHWEGIDGATERVEFVATSDVRAKAVLREDHTFLTLIVGIGTSVMLYMIFFRRRGLDIRFYFRMMYEYIRKAIERSSESLPDRSWG